MPISTRKTIGRFIGPCRHGGRDNLLLRFSLLSLVVPPASIKGYTGSLLLPHTRWKAEMQREFLQVIDEKADHLALLIDNLLEQARLGSGSLPLNREPVHLPAVTDQVVRRMPSQSHLPPHPYEVRFPARFPFIDADPDRIGQLHLNLLENTAKDSPPRTPILVEGDVEGQTVAVSVVDCGPGLTTEQARHTFDTFFRVDSGPTRATEGTGLGLAICRGVVEAHGGQIDVKTRPGKGCTFTFRLQAIPEQIPERVPVQQLQIPQSVTSAVPGEPS